MDRDIERGFDRGEVAIVLSKEPHAVRKLSEIYRALSGQALQYSSLKARGFPSTSAAMTARTISRRSAKSSRDALRGSLGTADAGFCESGRGWAPGAARGSGGDAGDAA